MGICYVSYSSPYRRIRHVLNACSMYVHMYVQLFVGLFIPQPPTASSTLLLFRRGGEDQKGERNKKQGGGGYWIAFGALRNCGGNGCDW